MGLIVNGGGGGGGGVTYNAVGTFASRPAAGTSGRIYVPTDGPITFLDDGSAWRPYVSGMMLGTAPPAAAGWTSLGVGSPTVADSFGSLFISQTTGNSSADQIQGFYIAAGTAPYTKTLAWQWIANPDASLTQNPMHFGLQASSTSKCIAYFIGQIANDSKEGANLWTSPSSAGSLITSNIVGDMQASNTLWARITDDGTTITIERSFNGIDWWTITAYTASAHFGAAARDRVFIGLNPYATTSKGKVRVVSFT